LALTSRFFFPPAFNERAIMERRQQAELHKLKKEAEATSKEQATLRSELASLRGALHKQSAQGPHTDGKTDDSELALEVSSLRKVVDSLKKGLATESQERKDFQGELKESEKVPEDDLPCQDAVIGQKCFKNVVWARTEGITMHPGWYGHLTESSSFKEFQMVLHKNGLYGCRRPCKPGEAKARARDARHDQAATGNGQHVRDETTEEDAGFEMLQ